MRKETADVVICGAGIAGVTAAYELAVKRGIGDVTLVDDRPPLTLTSVRSSECYRNWWPGPGHEMVRFMNRSIDLLEQLAAASGNFFHLNRRGYVYLTAVTPPAAVKEEAAAISRLGAGELRTDPDVYRYAPDAPLPGADFIDDPECIRETFPFLTPDVNTMLHVRRCGWLSAQQLGMYLLREAKAHGARLVHAQVTAVTTGNGRVQSVDLSNGRSLQTRTFINAAGPLLNQVSHMLDVDLPIYNELHSKIAFEDSGGIIPRHLPLMIWNEPIRLDWSDEEREFLAEDPAMCHLLEPLPAGLHFRPEGGPGSQTVLALWPYHIIIEEPHWPHQFDPELPDVIFRGLARMVPDLAVYVERVGKPAIDGGYYCKTRENRPLIGPLPVEGAFVIGALSGYGIMAAPAAAELLADHITGAAPAPYAPAFRLERYEDPVYQQLLADWDSTAGQL